MERDRFMTPQEAKAFGLIDHVVARRPPPDAGGDEARDAVNSS